MWSGDKLSRDRDGRCQTHNPLISPPMASKTNRHTDHWPVTIKFIYFLSTHETEIFLNLEGSAERTRRGALLGSRARAGAVCAVLAPRRLSLDCRHGNSIFLTFPPHLASPRSNCTPHE